VHALGLCATPSDGKNLQPSPIPVNAPILTTGVVGSA